jgi:hypothetical protein
MSFANFPSGHYDILYKRDNMSAHEPQGPAATQEMVVAFNHGQTTHTYTRLPFPPNDYEIPGMSIFPNPQITTHVTASVPWPGFSQYEFIPTHPNRVTPQGRPLSGPPAVYQIPPTAIHHPFYSSPNLSMEHPPSQPPMTPMSPASPASPSAPQIHGPFRPSRWEFETTHRANPHACQTTIFKKYVVSKDLFLMGC